jgi:redox-sensitive bicupin YhaK (pirin superfamily)
VTAIKHDSSSRGKADYGWLQSSHTFSFASYYNPERMNFGALRVLNDDFIAPTKGFDTHPHRNMEIISVPLSGALYHKDTIGNEHVIKYGEIQAMSAGTGISHSEYNQSDEEVTNFLQIWVIPKFTELLPSYSQKSFDPSQRNGKFQLIVSPDGREGSVVINQDAFFSLVDLREGEVLNYKKYIPENGVYLFNIKGKLKVNETELETRDGVGFTNVEELKLESQTASEVLVMEVPMI